MSATDICARVQAFLYDEADLIDRWKLDEWAALFAEDGWYYVPALDAEDPENASPDDILFIVADNRAHLNERVRRMDSASAYAERPRSRTLHSLSNVRVVREEGDLVRVRSHFLVHRTRYTETTTYFGVVHHTLRTADDSFRIVEKRCCLAVDALRPQGSISIVL